MTHLGSLYSRFGTPAHYIDYFVYDVDQTNIRQHFNQFNTDKGKSENYEASRQRFLKLLSKNRLIWIKSNESRDLDVDKSRLYRRDMTEYIAFLRIKPGGFRSERLVPEGKEYVFHVLIGNVIFVHKSRVRNLHKGNSITIQPKTNYSIRCERSNDQPAILIFRALDKTKPPTLVTID